MTEYADLELSLRPARKNTYIVELRYHPPKSDADIRPSPGLASFNLEKFSSSEYDIEFYGKTLYEQLFADEELQIAFAKARASAETSDIPIRLRLLIDPDVPDLQHLKWEAMRDPIDGSPLFTDQKLIFSRYLSSADWRPIRLSSRGDLSALVMVANPTDLSNYNLAPISTQDEFNMAIKNLGDLDIALIPDPNSKQRATLNNLVDKLQSKEFDIIYLVCHGTFVKDETWLWFEDDEGGVARVAGNELAKRINEFIRRPHLIVLASCQSAGNLAGKSLAALGPRLARAGIPAVVAMQGNISVQTMNEFMPVFFRELEREGHVDRAMAVARGAVRNRPDYWMPVLFMRLKSGRIWYVSGFTDPQGFRKWPALISNIELNKCTPILGPGLVEPLLGSHREISQRWAKTFYYPMFPHERDSLPQVAQYLAVEQDLRFPKAELARYLRQEIQNRYKDQLPSELFTPQRSLDELIDVVGKTIRQRNTLDAHKVLATLPIPVFITANVDNLIASTLREVGKEPQVVISPWREYIYKYESIFDREPDYTPTPDRPLVYHLFGRLDDPESVVLTEDDYFKYLIGITKNNNRIPTSVRHALTNTALLFLGFQLNDWNFRVLFQSLLTQAGRAARERPQFAHISVQIEPEEDRILEPESARRYLESYFSREANIFLYWGSIGDFIKELSARMRT